MLIAWIATLITLMLFDAIAFIFEFIAVFIQLIRDAIFKPVDFTPVKDENEEIYKEDAIFKDDRTQWEWIEQSRDGRKWWIRVKRGELPLMSDERQEEEYQKQLGKAQEGEYQEQLKITQSEWIEQSKDGRRWWVRIDHKDPPSS